MEKQGEYMRIMPLVCDTQVFLSLGRPRYLFYGYWADLAHFDTLHLSRRVNRSKEDLR